MILLKEEDDDWSVSYSFNRHLLCAFSPDNHTS